MVVALPLSHAAPAGAAPVVLTDGTRYNKTIASTHFPEAVHIIDLYHAREHLAGLAKTIGIDDAQFSAWPTF